jgi:hypothetical protein
VLAVFSNVAVRAMTTKISMGGGKPTFLTCKKLFGKSKLAPKAHEESSQT